MESAQLTVYMHRTMKLKSGRRGIDNYDNNDNNHNNRIATGFTGKKS